MRPRPSGTATSATGAREIADAVAAQMHELAAYSTFGDLSNPAGASSSPSGCPALAPVPDSKVFLTSGGSDSIDTAAKMARRYWQLVGAARADQS